MTEIQERLLARARERCGIIEPCAGRIWEECFTIIRGRLALWFNDQTGNTKMELEAPGKEAKAS